MASKGSSQKIVLTNILDFDETGCILQNMCESKGHKKYISDGTYISEVVIYNRRQHKDKER